MTNLFTAFEANNAAADQQVSSGIFDKLDYGNIYSDANKALFPDDASFQEWASNAAKQTSPLSGSGSSGGSNEKRQAEIEARKLELQKKQDEFEFSIRDQLQPFSDKAAELTSESIGLQTAQTAQQAAQQEEEVKRLLEANARLGSGLFSFAQKDVSKFFANLGAVFNDDQSFLGGLF